MHQILAHQVLRYLAWIVAIVLASAHAAQARSLQPRRVALVIGNAAYSQPLANPVNDAEAIAQALTDLGFAKVIRATNAGKAQMETALTELSREAQGAEIAAVFFAGHGTERDGRNYLIPIDAKLERASDLDLQAIALPTVLDRVSGASKLKLVLLDASRSNNFPLAGNRRSVARGLARIEPNDGTLVVYSAKHGSIAEDVTPGGNSPFAKALVAALLTPGLDIRFLIGGVVDEVRARTNGRQEPFMYGTMGAAEVPLKSRLGSRGTDMQPIISAPRTGQQVQEREGRLDAERGRVAPLPAPAPFPTARRVALVIGNAAYAQQPLANPVNDAEAIAQALTDLGFAKVIRTTNATKAQMLEKLGELSREAQGAEIAAVFFAGHGTERDGRNYLIPVDAKLERASDLDLQAIALPTVLDQLAGATKLKLVILDACRNNVFPLAGNRRSATRGLARIEPDDNTLVAYAAKDGTVAADGAGQKHSPFTAALLKHIKTPGVEIDYLFRLVRDDVLAATNREQTPHVYGTLGKERISLKDLTPPASVGPDAPAKQPSLGAPRIAAPTPSAPTSPPAPQKSPQPQPPALPPPTVAKLPAGLEAAVEQIARNDRGTELFVTLRIANKSSSTVSVLLAGYPNLSENGGTAYTVQNVTGITTCLMGPEMCSGRGIGLAADVDTYSVIEPGGELGINMTFLSDQGTAQGRGTQASIAASLLYRVIRDAASDERLSDDERRRGIRSTSLSLRNHPISSSR